MTGTIAALRKQIKKIQPKGRWIVCITEDEIPPDATARDTILILGEEYRDI